MHLELLRQADLILSKCGGRRVTPDGVIVPLERKILMPMLLTPNRSMVFTKEITGDTFFALRAISSDQTAGDITGVRIQIQLPNGRFLIGGNGQDVGQFAWIGSWRYNVDPEQECAPGSKIQVTLTDLVGLSDPFAMNLVFEGADNYYLRGEARDPAAVTVSDEPRYQGILNENILAPCFLAGYGPTTPDGYMDEQFTYSSVEATLPLTGPLFAQVKIPIDAGYDFQMRRFHFEILSDAGVTAAVILARLRAGSGYAFNDDFLDLARYVGGAEYPHDWKVRGQDAVYVDMQLADGAGAGSVTAVVHLEGVRRRKL